MAKDRQKVIQAAEKLAARGRIQAAIDEYRKVLDRHPNDTTTLNRVGDLYVRLNRLPKAIDLFQKTAESFSRQGFFVKAIAIYKKMIRLEPGQIRAYEALADLYHRQGLTGDSLAQYQVVADYYLKHEDIESAVKVQRSMVEIEPENPTRRLQLADVLKRDGRPAKAQEQYQAIADLMLEHSRGDDAAKVLQGALDIDAGNLDFVRQAIHSLQSGGFDRLADELLEEAIRRNPQANVLRLDALDTPAAAPAAEEAGSAVEALESEAAASEPAMAEPEESPAEATPAAETRVEETPLEETPSTAAPSIEAPSKEEPVLEDAVEELSEIELSELEALPAGGLDPVVEAPGVEPPARDEPAAEIADSSDESAFELDDVELDEAAEPEVAAQAQEPEEEFTFELDIDEVSAQLVDTGEAADVIAAAETAESPAPAASAQPETETEPEPETETEPAGEWAKLLTEADVLARYGMNDMAAGVLDRILKESPEHGGAQVRLALLLVSAERLPEAVALGDRVAARLASEGEPERWSELCAALAAQGFALEGGRFVGDAVAAAPPAEPATTPPAPSEEVSQLLDVPADEAFEQVVEEALEEVLPEPAETPVAEEPAAEELAQSAEAAETIEPEAPPKEPLSLDQIVAETAELSRPRPPAPADSADGVLAEVIEEIERKGGAAEPAVPADAGVADDEPPAEETEVEVEAQAPTEPAEEPVAEPSAESVEAPSEAPATADLVLPDDDVEWIRELERVEAEAGSTAPLEPGTGEFVDLATELEAELSDDAGFEDELLPTMGEQSLEDIVEGFRQGMAETLADEDYDTHYNLGIAYREMGLIDEAIGEFQLAAKDPRFLVECCSHLASCFVEKNFNDLAVQWYARGLESSAIDEESRCGLLYELGSLLAAIGEPDAARERFLELYGINSNYRDVVAKLEELPS